VAVLAFSVAASTVFSVSVVVPALAGGLVVALVATVVPRLRRRAVVARTRRPSTRTP
jgi:UDP-GlcNAc:undecaprenyl-phosphate GlcNAc-1-phosphate transferase